MIKGMIFDLDGTLLDTLPVCYLSFRAVFQQFLGKEYSDREIDALFGPTEEGIFQQLLPNDWERCLETYLQVYDKVHTDYAEPFPGIFEMLNLLQHNKVRMAIVSGKGPKSMALSLKHSGLGGFFSTVATGSAKGANKPEHIKKILANWNLPVSTVAYLGDTSYDIKAAREAGVRALGAGWAGTARSKGTADMQPEAMFYSVDAMLEWIRSEL